MKWGKTNHSLSTLYAVYKCEKCLTSIIKRLPKEAGERYETKLTVLGNLTSFFAVGIVIIPTNAHASVDSCMFWGPIMS